MTLAPPHLAQQQRGLDRSQGGLPSLVLARIRQSATVERLLRRVAGEHAEPYRDTGVQSDAGETVGDRAADVVEVRGAAADDDAESHDGVIALLRQRLGGDTQLERSLAPPAGDILDPAVAQRGHR